MQKAGPDPGPSKSTVGRVQSGIRYSLEVWSSSGRAEVWDG